MKRQEFIRELRAAGCELLRHGEAYQEVPRPQELAAVLGNVLHEPRPDAGPR
jgi:hypothetical protein